MYPNLNTPSRLEVDASGSAVGAVLSQQKEDEEWYPVEFASRQFSQQEERWRSCPRFDIYTDHESLSWVWGTPIGNVGRWALRLQEYSFTIHHRKGNDNVVADHLSRSVVHLPTEANIDRVALQWSVICSVFAERAGGGIRSYICGSPRNWQNHVALETSPLVAEYERGYSSILEAMSTVC
eukprot:GHVN01064609.1.p1 GENE.GHVN01064609.1~~GHVN01064609.1.p1  ORF type:complete len:181 (+),score=11.57 GHVN01064609.1:1961-2503(+)